MSKFGTILRDLRLERGFTQAEVGEGIGVSPQAVSKWENENGLPDVTQLIPLADYFGVTVDALLGHDPDKDEREILAHIERLEGKLTDEGNWDAQMDENRAMLRKYPKDCRLMIQMCRILYYYPKETGIDGSPESDRCADELVEWGEKVLRESTDSHLRNEAVRWLVYTLDIQGKFDKGKKYAEMMPPYELCRENLMQYLDSRFYTCLKGTVINLDKVERMEERPEERRIYFLNGEYLLIGRDNFIRTKQRYAAWLKNLIN